MSTTTRTALPTSLPAPIAAKFNAFCEQYRLLPEDAIETLMKGWDELNKGQQYEAMQKPLPVSESAMDAHHRRVDAHMTELRQGRRLSCSAA